MRSPVLATKLLKKSENTVFRSYPKKVLVELEKETRGTIGKFVV